MQTPKEISQSYDAMIQATAKFKLQNSDIKGLQAFLRNADQ